MLKDTGASPQLKIWLLGTFQVAAGPRIVNESAWRLRKARSLVKLLAIAVDHRLHREQVMEALWPDLDPDRAANNLHQVLHFTRHTLQPALSARAAPDYLTLREDVIALSSTRNLWVDCDAFAAAAARARQTQDPAVYREALDLYPGVLLPTDLYEDWATARREELQQLHQALLWELANLYQDRRDLTSAQAVFERLIASDPLQEEAHVALMRLHAMSGRAHQALQQYDRLRETLERELGTQPAESSQRLHQEILEGRYAQKTAVEEQEKAPAGVTAVRKKVHRPRRAVAARPPGNLPAPVTSFVGRERDKSEVKALLSRARLVTLTGIGGAGKTRLAIEVARELIPDFRDGVWLVELAPLSDGALVAHTVASALNVGEEPGRAMLDTLKESLRDKRLLLVLDNCEHLADVTAALASALLQFCPLVCILATSRERLKLAGESIWRVPSLSVPDPRHLGAPATLNEFEATRLFLERGAAVSPEFALTERNAQDIGQICWQLDGLPLPIELAASRLSVLSCRQIAERLADRFRLLRTESALVSPRHRTLEAVMGWSYDLLSDEERTLFRRLSIFAGGFTLEAAETVYEGRTDEFDVIDLLTRLVDKSLIIPEDHGGEVRYRLLETVRQYGQDKLNEAGEAEEIRRRHRDFFLGLAEEAKPHLSGAEQKKWLDRLEVEHDNLRAAMDWSLEREEVNPLLRLAGALTRFWDLRGHVSEGRRWLQNALAASAGHSGSERAEALRGAGVLAWDQGDLGQAKLLLEESVALSRLQRDQRGTASTLNNLGNVAGDQGDYEAAQRLYEESLALSRTVGDKRVIAATLNNLGDLHYKRGDYPLARSLFAESLVQSRELGDASSIARSTGNLGNVACDQGDYASARSLHEESLALKRELGDKRGIAASIRSLGDVPFEQGDYANARSLYEESLALRRELGDKWGSAECLDALGDAVCKQGDYALARPLHQESLTLYHEVGAKKGMAESLERLAALAAAEGRTERAARLFGAAEAMRESIGGPLSPRQRADYESNVSKLQKTLNTQTFTAEWTAGRQMTVDEAVKYGLGE